MARKKAVPAKKGRVKQRVNLTLDPDTLTRLKGQQDAMHLDSLSATVRALSRLTVTAPHLHE